MGAGLRTSGTPSTVSDSEMQPGLAPRFAGPYAMAPARRMIGGLVLALMPLILEPPTIGRQVSNNRGKNHGDQRCGSAQLGR
jgi:hypothetical protein